MKKQSGSKLEIALKPKHDTFKNKAKRYVRRIATVGILIYNGVTVNNLIKEYKDYNDVIYSQNMKTVSNEDLEKANSWDYRVSAIFEKNKDSLISKVNTLGAAQTWARNLNQESEEYLSKQEKVNNINSTWGNLDKILYGKRDYMASLKQTLEKKFGDCDDGASGIAALLSDDGIPPYILILRREDSNSGHAVFVYKTEDNKYGSLGINIKDDISPNQDLQTLIKNLGYDSGYIQDLSNRNDNFISGDINLFAKRFQSDKIIYINKK